MSYIDLYLFIKIYNIGLFIRGVDGPNNIVIHTLTIKILIENVY